MAAAVNLQRDAGLMLSNLQILSHFATSLHHMSFEMMVLGIGQMVFPQAELGRRLVTGPGGKVHVGHGPLVPSDGSR